MDFQTKAALNVAAWPKCGVVDLNMPHLSMVQRAIQEAAELPINDAAFALWSKKFELDREEFSAAPKIAPPCDIADPKVFGNIVRRIFTGLQFDAANAGYGSTFPRLKASHPTAPDSELRNAIGLAVRLEQSSMKSFTYSNTRPYWDDVSAAIEKVRLENPDFIFLESTYRSLYGKMVQSLR